MINRLLFLLTALCFIFSAGTGFSQDKEILGIKFPGEKVVEGKTLKLNGVAYLKKYGFVKVYAGGFYLENPTKNPYEAIESEQVKHFDLHYLTSKATAKKLQDGFKELMIKCNSPSLVSAHREDIEKHASWMDKDMAPGKTSKTTYVPGVGLIVEYQEEVKGTIPGKEYAQMYYRYIFGEKADKKIKKGYLGQ
ncbi:MAG: hypothetical protein HN737_11370 [Desulfobacterales bacterium]|jgi:hypothetical protein|nr:hypothetical protein [Desulfobacteraceae bacterium]MBT4365498.1 hypothetical protein [Desulfobacteraceae bacterium]MBT7085951.1 hypothetical protein [Desulfobacterales bacterium]MBT7697995.1 hypothetical protein [Desulfobacterales bacterium]